jgi:hypothetical protein
MAARVRMKEKKCTFAAQFKTHFLTNKQLKNYGKSVRNRFHYDARFI